jgi:hypothetical protein
MSGAGEHPAVARIREYFAVYQRSDSVGYAAQWIYPAAFWSGSAWGVVADPPAMVRNNDDYERAERARGVASGRVLQLRCEPLSETAALVHGSFESSRADGSVVAVVNAVYTVVRVGDTWKVAVCVVQR